MADSSANWDPKAQEGKIHEFLMEDNVHIYKGDGVEANAAGYALPMGDDANCVFLGVAIEEVDNTLTGHSQGGKKVRVQMGGNAVFLKASAAQTDLGLSAYASYDKTVVLSGASNPMIVGRVIEIIDTTHVRVQMKLAENVPDTTHYFYGAFCFHIKLAKLANGDIVTNFHAPFAGELLMPSVVVSDPATTASKLASLNLEIGTTNVTGGGIDLTSANMTPLGAVVDGAAVTGNNAFSAGDHISIEASSVTAFVEGEIEIIVPFRGLLQA